MSTKRNHKIAKPKGNAPQKPKPRRNVGDRAPAPRSVGPSGSAKENIVPEATIPPVREGVGQTIDRTISAARRLAKKGSHLAKESKHWIEQAGEKLKSRRAPRNKKAPSQKPTGRA